MDATDIIISAAIMLIGEKWKTVLVLVLLAGAFFGAYYHSDILAWVKAL
ncbi:hypothetical protein [Aquamicrobium soli]|uniref:Uncharacterized protein n=1 Tax=Aquamicrobium soli TaxID=1811518 RepID=A0ABV7KCX9_9HYPH